MDVIYVLSLIYVYSVYPNIFSKEVYVTLVLPPAWTVLILPTIVLAAKMDIISPIPMVFVPLVHYIAKLAPVHRYASAVQTVTTSTMVNALNVVHQIAQTAIPYNPTFVCCVSMVIFWIATIPASNVLQVA